VFETRYNLRHLAGQFMLPAAAQIDMLEDPPAYCMVPATLEDGIAQAVSGHWKPESRLHALTSRDQFELVLIPTVMDTLSWDIAEQYWNDVFLFAPGMLELPGVFGRPSHPYARYLGADEYEDDGISCLWVWSAWPLQPEQAVRLNSQVDAWMAGSPYPQMMRWSDTVMPWGDLEALNSSANEPQLDLPEPVVDLFDDTKERALQALDDLFEIEKGLVVEPVSSVPLALQEDFVPQLDEDLSAIWQSLLTSRHRGIAGLNRALSRQEREQIRSDHFQWP
jgi:hypothetical protein